MEFQSGRSTGADNKSISSQYLKHRIRTQRGQLSTDRSVFPHNDNGSGTNSRECFAVDECRSLASCRHLGPGWEGMRSQPADISQF